MLTTFLLFYVASAQLCEVNTDCQLYLYKEEGKVCPGGGGYDKAAGRIITTVRACRTAARSIQPACEWARDIESCAKSVFKKVEEIRSPTAPAGCFFVNHGEKYGGYRLFFNVDPTNKAEGTSSPICINFDQVNNNQNALAGGSVSYYGEKKLVDTFAFDSKLIDCEYPQTNIRRNCRPKSDVRVIKNFWFYVRGELDWAYQGRNIANKSDMENYVVYVAGAAVILAIVAVSSVVFKKNVQPAAEYDSLLESA